MAATREDSSSGYRRCRCRREAERRVDDEGHEAEESPSTNGPCEHGVKPRSKCKVCSACPHGRRRRKCKECGGSQICEHGRRRSHCKECGGSQICEHGRQRSNARSAVGHIYASTVVSALSARSAVGHRYASTVVSATNCKECGGSREYASTVVGALSAKIATRRNSSCIRPNGLAARHLLPFRPAFMAFAAPAGIDTFTPPPHINCAKSPAAPSADRIISLHLASNAPSRSFSSLL